MHKVLAAAGLDVDLRHGDPVDQMWIRLTPDHAGRRPILELLFVSDLLRHLEQVAGRESAPPVPDAVDTLQFYVHLPFGVEPEAFPELARFVLLLNGGLPLTGLSIRESDGAVYFRHLMMFAGSPDDRLVIETVEIIDLILRQYGEDLERVAAGDKTLTQVMA